jgi:hypothetical protein
MKASLNLNTKSGAKSERTPAHFKKHLLLSVFIIVGLYERREEFVNF